MTKFETRSCTNIEHGDYIQFLRIIYCKLIPKMIEFIEPSMIASTSIAQPLTRSKSTEPAIELINPPISITPTLPPSPNQFEMLRLCSKVFVATKFDHPLDSMQQRIYSWLNSEPNQNVCILSAETINIYAKDDDERWLEKKSNECFQENRLGSLNTFTFRAVRLYYCSFNEMKSFDCCNLFDANNDVERSRISKSSKKKSMKESFETFPRIKKRSIVRNQQQQLQRRTTDHKSDFIDNDNCDNDMMVIKRKNSKRNKNKSSKQESKPETLTKERQQKQSDCKEIEIRINDQQQSDFFVKRQHHHHHHRQNRRRNSEDNLNRKKMERQRTMPTIPINISTTFLKSKSPLMLSVSSPISSSSSISQSPSPPPPSPVPTTLSTLLLSSESSLSSMPPTISSLRNESQAKCSSSTQKPENKQIDSSETVRTKNIRSTAATTTTTTSSTASCSCI